MYPIDIILELFKDYLPQIERKGCNCLFLLTSCELYRLPEYCSIFPYGVFAVRYHWSIYHELFLAN